MVNEFLNKARAGTATSNDARKVYERLGKSYDEQLLKPFVVALYTHIVALDGLLASGGLELQFKTALLELRTLLHAVYTELLGLASEAIIVQGKLERQNTSDLSGGDATSTFEDEMQGGNAETTNLQYGTSEVDGGDAESFANETVLFDYENVFTRKATVAPTAPINLVQIIFRAIAKQSSTVYFSRPLVLKMTIRDYFRVREALRIKVDVDSPETDDDFLKELGYYLQTLEGYQPYSFNKGYSWLSTDALLAAVQHAKAGTDSLVLVQLFNLLEGLLVQHSDFGIYSWLYDVCGSITARVCYLAPPEQLHNLEASKSVVGWSRYALEVTNG